MFYRAAFTVILLFSVLFMPFWFSVLLSIGAMAYFRTYFEASLLMLLSDLMFGVEQNRYFQVTFVSFILSLLFLIIIEILKKKLKFYPEN